MDWCFIKSCQIGIKQLSGYVILNLGYPFCLAFLSHNVSRIKWYRRGVNLNPILFSGKIHFLLLIFHRWIVYEKCHFFKNHICHSTSFFPIISCHDCKLYARFQFVSCTLWKRWCIHQLVTVYTNCLKRYLICGWLYPSQYVNLKHIGSS